MRYFEIKNRKLTLENTERIIKNEQSRETGNIGYTRRRKTKQKHSIFSIEIVIFGNEN
jgi:hypothetical protein